MSDETAFPKGDLMKGKRGLIMGVANKNSIAWGIAQQLAAQGAELCFSYIPAMEGRVRQLAETVGVEFLVEADVMSDDDMDSGQIKKQSWVQTKQETNVPDNKWRGGQINAIAKGTGKGEVPQGNCHACGEQGAPCEIAQ